jgi:hypothetical protein
VEKCCCSRVKLGQFRSRCVRLFIAVTKPISDIRRECGEKDQFNPLYGARRFVRRLNELGIAYRYEEFPDNHTSVDYRMDESLPFLAQALSS